MTAVLLPSAAPRPALYNSPATALVARTEHAGTCLAAVGGQHGQFQHLLGGPRQDDWVRGGYNRHLVSRIVGLGLLVNF